MKEFKWKIDSQSSARFRKTLKKGETYKVNDFTADVVDHWVKQGAAEYINESTPVKREKLSQGKNGGK